MTSTYALFTFQLIAFIILVLLMHDLHRKLRRTESAAREGGPDAAQMRAGVDELVAELRRAAERINADISTRAATLQKLVDEADQKMRALDAAVARQDRLPAARPARPAPAPAPVPVARPPEPARVAAPAARPLAEPARRAPTAVTGIQSSREPGTERPQASRPDDGPWPGAPASEPTRTLPQVTPAAGAAGNAYRQAARSAPPPPRDDFVAVGLDDTGKFQTVRRLAAEGLSAAEIARATQLGREEVELIMQLSGDARS